MIQPESRVGPSEKIRYAFAANRTVELSAKSRRLVDTLVLVAIVAAIGLAGYISRLLSRDVFSGVPQSVPVSTIAATCQADVESRTCATVVIALNPGRFRVETSVPTSRLTVTVGDPSATARSRFLLLRTGVPGRLLIEADAGAGTEEILSADLRAGDRSVNAVPARASDWNRMTFIPAPTPEPLVIDELGFFEDQVGLAGPSKLLFFHMPGVRTYSIYSATATLAVCAFVVLAVWFAPAAVPNGIGPWFIAVLCFSICMLELGISYSPHRTRDLRSMYAGEVAHFGGTGNLTGGLYEGSRIVQGLGQTVPPGIVPWHRMPGYGLFCALAAAVGRTTDVIDIAMVVIALQVILYSVTVGLFVLAAQRVFRPWMAWLLGLSIALLPKQLGNTQVDSIIAPMSLLVLTALLVYLADENDEGRTRFRWFLLVNGAFALWFFMRNDVLPGWIAIALVLAHRRWRYLAVPVILIVTIALAWAFYKQPYKHELDLMPTNTGEVLFLSLCEVPGAFPYECTDEGYFDWARGIGQSDPTSNKASHLAVAAVLRHWMTYPVHFTLMVGAKFRRCMFTTCWSGIQTPLNWSYHIIREAGAFVMLLALVIVSMAVNHERRRSFLLGWALFFNMPLFFVVYESGGRFNVAAGVSLLVAAIPLLFEPGLYAQMARHPWRVAAVAACVAAFFVGGRHVEEWIVKNDSLHYWAPLLDPGKSTLRFTSR